ncbi:hypothetical protein NPX13_g7641 [Xylaria arbuscula]|uniref:DUF7820 domain-containing protein n=1 Tax=Xylaria arbuscula TaxID=114810 RepID=A0A9W8NA78_9PEZI|nr:hypothetical protein NPX13_g7641 [Xylaria arbuscula]
MGDPADTKSSELDRRLSRAASTRLSHVLREGDDDYDLQAMAISDGFRPVQNTQPHHASHVTFPSQSSIDPSPARAMPSRPSSVAKPVPGHDFSGPYNASSGLERGPVRSSTMSTEMPAETPYEGPRGPSHPYQMYPQDVRLARTASLATTSTAPISERSYNGPRGPTHAYGLYPQNVGTTDEVPSGGSPQGSINVGFPGTTDNYQRRLGPDGEEVADMIGPDGHTEQLPPYTRYPEEAYVQKAAGINVAQSTPASSSSSAQTEQQTAQNLVIPGAGGIGLATRNPEFSSTEDLHQLNSPQSRHSVRSMVSEVSHHSINTAARAVTNEKEKNWKTAARRKVWGVVPCWALILGAIILVLLGVILGTVIGTVFGRQFSGKDRNDDDSYSATKPAGFVPLASVPPGLPALVEGPYSLPLMSPRFSNTCFKDGSQGRAWNCDAIMAQLTMSIRRKSDSTDVTAYALDLTYNHSYTIDSNVYSYGVQPPSLSDQQLMLVDDTFEPSRGPAWALALPYEKTVILPEQFLTYSDGQSQRRSMFGFDFKRKGLAQSGEKPWICTWPSTILEILIYPNQTNTYQYQPPPSSTGSPSSSPAPTASSSGGQTAKNRREAIAPFDFDDYDDDYDSRKEEDYPHTDSTSSSSTSPAASSTSSPTSSMSTTASGTSSAEPNYFSPPPMPPPPFPPYPKIVKVEERRDPEIGAAAPTCRQIEVGEKGVKAIPALDDDGNPIVVQIEEIMVETSKKEMRPFYKRESFGPSMWQRDDGSELSDCGCIWWLT